MGEFYATRGPFGLAARFNYLDLRSEQSRAGLIDTELKLKLTAGVNDFLASWRVHDRVRLLTGIRHGDNDRNFSAEFRGIYRFGRLNNLWFGYRYLRIGNDTLRGSDRGDEPGVQPPWSRGSRKISASGGMLRSRMSR